MPKPPFGLDLAEINVWDDDPSIQQNNRMHLQALMIEHVPSGEGIGGGKTSYFHRCDVRWITNDGMWLCISTRLPKASEDAGVLCDARTSTWVRKPKTEENSK